MTSPRSFSQRPYVGPPGSTELLLVRHGASADAVEGEDFELVEGQGDPPLSDIGRRQAELVAALKTAKRGLSSALTYLAGVRGGPRQKSTSCEAVRDAHRAVSAALKS